jgi:hypothetical protein
MSASSLNFLRRLILSFLLIGFLGGGAYAIFKFYPYLFAKTVNGRIENVERVSPAEAIITGGGTVPAEQLFSMAISIKDAKGEIHTASSEDRQWAVVRPGQCAEAKFFPYPPWNLQKSGTYYGARLLKLYDCEAAAAVATPAQ